MCIRDRNIYPNPNSSEHIIHKGLPIIGMLILIGSLLIYKGKSYSGDPLGFSTHWWGILGLIGWSYFMAASSYFIFRRSLTGAIIAFGICLGLNILSSSGVGYNIFSWQSKDWIPGSGGLQALAFGGIITSLVLMKYKDSISLRPTM